MVGHLEVLDQTVGFGIADIRAVEEGAEEEEGENWEDSVSVVRKAGMED